MTTARLLAPLALLLLMLSPGAFAHDGHDHGAAHARIADGKPLQPADGKVEVVEIFAYTCGHCANFEPTLKAWVRKAPLHVRFVYLPAAFSLDNNYARAYFAAESMGVLDRFHGAAYEAIHRLGTLPGRNASVAEFAAFVRSLDIDPARFAAAMTSPGTDAKMREAYEFAVRSGIQGTPTLVVNGRHRIQGQTHDETLHLVDTAIASEHDAR